MPPTRTPWLCLITCLALFSTTTSAAPQILHLGQSPPYNFLAYSNTDLTHPQPATRAIVILHGVRRNAEDYYRSGLQLLANAGLNGQDTLLLAPNFLTPRDSTATRDMPLWPKDRWMHGSPSTDGQRGIAAFSVLDDLLAYLTDRQRYPHLREIVLIGHSAGAQLMQRYAVLTDGTPQTPGIAIRYVVSSPSTYLYLDSNRPRQGGFAPLPLGQCPDYNHYRYGLEQAPLYLTRQGLDARQLFRRYASRDVTYLVGERDTHADSKVMDHSCGAEAQGRNRLERQLDYLRYEGFLSRTWGVAVAHRQFVIPEAGHDAGHLFASPSVAEVLFARKP
ncbi:alpha/beta fold hydrolase [Pseudomonas sp. microsymbiont 2]